MPSEPSGAWELIAAYRLSVVKFLQRKCRDIHQAEDLAHDTLIKAARYGNALAHVARPGAWLMQIAANVQRDFVRKEIRHRLLPPTDDLFHEVIGTEPIPGESPGANYYEVDGQRFAEDLLVAEIRELWNGMSVRDRTVLSSYYREGGSAELAAANCGIDRNLVKIRLFRARRRLEADLRRRLDRA
ncbi:RNA polymerase sigma factor [Saltatorellus ferox]